MDGDGVNDDALKKAVRDAAWERRGPRFAKQGRRTRCCVDGSVRPPSSMPLRRAVIIFRNIRKFQWVYLMSLPMSSEGVLSRRSCRLARGLPHALLPLQICFSIWSPGRLPASAG